MTRISKKAAAEKAKGAAEWAIGIAAIHVTPGASAQSLKRAKEFMGADAEEEDMSQAGAYHRSIELALESLLYSIGRRHDDYKRVLDKSDEIERIVDSQY